MYLAIKMKRNMKRGKKVYPPESNYWFRNNQDEKRVHVKIVNNSELERE